MSLRMIHYYPRAWTGDGGCSSAVRGWASAVADAGAQVTVVSDGTGEPPRLRTCAGSRRRIERGAECEFRSVWSNSSTEATCSSCIRGGSTTMCRPPRRQLDRESRTC